ncbi:MAG: hypothetical protein J6I31_00560 [Prevotella sp.]|nr:hypothetical protein [Prevotella sp.]
MEKRKRYVQPECEAIDMDVCVLDISLPTDGETDSEDVIGGAPGYQGPIDDTPVPDDGM